MQHYRTRQDGGRTKVVTWLKKQVRRAINLAGYEIRKRADQQYSFPGGPDQRPPALEFDRIQYACGPKFLKGWVNVDCYPPAVMRERFAMPPDQVYYQVDLSGRQPFADQTFALAYAEDFIEHLGQQDAIIFLSECWRVLKPGGVLRLSFPGLAGVLRRHFSSREYGVLRKGVEDAYLHYEHRHFFSREELALVAGHLGFSRVSFTGYGESDHEGLRGLETRDQQQDLNIYAELTR